jgi:hypothetical protein
MRRSQSRRLVNASHEDGRGHAASQSQARSAQSNDHRAAKGETALNADLGSETQALLSQRGLVLRSDRNDAQPLVRRRIDEPAKIMRRHDRARRYPSW